MRLTKFTHACVQLEKDGKVLVVDPGIWAEPAALSTADAVLITHEHFDHVDLEGLRAAVAANPALGVWTNPDLAAQLGDLGGAVVAVRPGTRFTAAGFAVLAVGGQHAYIHEKTPELANVGFVIEDSVYHPGDAYFVPDVPVETLLVPTSGPWVKLGESIDFVRAVHPRRAHSVHDYLLSETGLQLVDRWLDQRAETDYSRLPTGEPVDL